MPSIISFVVSYVKAGWSDTHVYIIFIMWVRKQKHEILFFLDDFKSVFSITFMSAFELKFLKACLLYCFFHAFLLSHVFFFLSSPPGITCPTSCTVRAEFLSSVLTLMTPWLRPPKERMARAGRGAPGTPDLHKDTVGSNMFVYIHPICSCYYHRPI